MATHGIRVRLQLQLPCPVRPTLQQLYMAPHEPSLTQGSFPPVSYYCKDGNQLYLVQMVENQ